MITMRYHTLMSYPRGRAPQILSYASPPRSALDLIAKNQGHIAPGVLQQLLARNTGLGAKLQTLQQVNEQTASHLGRGCASQAPRFHLLLETFRESLSGCGEALPEPRTDF